MWPFRKKKQKHILRDIGTVPSYYYSDRAVRCEKCGKTYAMEMLGGWAIEWDLKADERGWKVDPDDIKVAVQHRRKLPVSQWLQLDEDVCPGPKGSESTEPREPNNKEIETPAK